MAATNVNRGETPASWNATGPQTTPTQWKSLDANAGVADRHGAVARPFEDGPGTRWKQT
jgi:hypothetical protein